MNTYMAGTPGVFEREILHWAPFLKNRLVSFWDIKNNAFSARESFFYYSTHMKNKVKLFLDSGAFSAWSQGEEIDIQEYIKFIKEHKDSIEIYANLDVIGDPEGTWRNQVIMEKAGLSPLPVFHYGEDIKWLKRILSKGYEYMSLGGMVPISNKDLLPWLDMLWSQYLTDEKGFPICKVHGFGLTSLHLMLRYPWYSVDSTTWVVTARMGSIFVPRFKNGEAIYDENCWTIAVSNKSPNMKEQGQHFETLPESSKKLILNYLEQKGYKYGKSEWKMESQEYELQPNEKWGEKKPKNKSDKRSVEIIIEEGVCNKYQLRDEVNIHYFQDLEKTIQKWPWKFQLSIPKSLF